MRNLTAWTAGVSPGQPGGRLARRSFRISCVISIALFIATAAAAGTFKFFGSTGGEAQLTPPNTESPLNPGNFLGVPKTTNVADVTLFADATAEDRAWKVHLKLRGDASDRGPDTLRFNEGFGQVSVRSWLDITVGRVIEKWGTGYAWNPVGFISPRKNPVDPNDRRFAYSGLDMVRADLFVHGTNVSLYALEHQKFALRAYRLVSDTDISLYGHVDGEGDREGFSLARVFGDALELHGEIARISADATFVRVLAGGQYTFSNDLNIVVEVYHAGDGLTASEWSNYTEVVDSAQTPPEILAANSVYVPMQMARSYAFTRLFFPWDSQKNEAELIVITNLRDGSSTLRFGYTRKLRPNLTAYLIQTEFTGGRDTEFSYIQVKRMTIAGVRYHF